MSSKIFGAVVFFLVVLNCAVWFAVFSVDANALTVSFLDIGQGDATFIQTPGGRQILVDGGPNSSVLRELSSVMPWYDHSIDVVVATHPDLDHIGGLLDVLSRYSVSTIVLSSVQGETPAWQTFQTQIESARERGVSILEAERGEVIDLGDGARLEILFPDRRVPHVATNVGCIVSRVVYGETVFMLPCDATAEVEEYLVSLDGKNLRSNVLKAAHHGSKTSSSAFFVGAVDPDFAVYSRGCGNSYGHPHAQTVGTFKRFGVRTFDTCEMGTITFVSDGKVVVLR